MNPKVQMNMQKQFFHIVKVRIHSTATNWCENEEMIIFVSKFTYYVDVAIGFGVCRCYISIAHSIETAATTYSSTYSSTLVLNLVLTVTVSTPFQWLVAKGDRELRNPPTLLKNPLNLVNLPRLRFPLRIRHHAIQVHPLQRPLWARVVHRAGSSTSSSVPSSTQGSKG